MAAISLFWDTNMAAVTSCENTLYVLSYDHVNELRRTILDLTRTWFNEKTKLPSDSKDSAKVNFPNIIREF